MLGSDKKHRQYILYFRIVFKNLDFTFIWEVVNYKYVVNRRCHYLRYKRHIFSNFRYLVLKHLYN